MLHIQRQPIARRGLSLIEMLIALAISAMLLTAALSALDVMFKGYKQITESASTHVVSRIVMSRLQGLIRTGTSFGPVPADILDETQNPLATDYFEAIVKNDANGNPLEMIRIEYRFSDGTAPNRVWSPDDPNPPMDPLNPPPAGPGDLWFVLFDVTTDPPTMIQEHPLISGVQRATFTMLYDVGPQLHRCTIDMTIEPNDSRDLTIGSDIVAQTFRLVASGAPRTGLQ